MKALTFQEAYNVAVGEVAEPALEVATDGIVEISSGIDMRFEEMTGWLNAPVNYSALTHWAMADLGYEPAVGAPVELLQVSIE